MSLSILKLASCLPIKYYDRLDKDSPDAFTSLAIKVENKVNTETFNTRSEKLVGERGIYFLNKDGIKVEQVVDVNKKAANMTYQEFNNLAETDSNIEAVYDESNKLLRSQLRPGMHVTRYAVELTPSNNRTFYGRLVAHVVIIMAREKLVMFYVRGLNIDSIEYSLSGSTNAMPVENFEVDDDTGILKIQTGVNASTYTFFIEYQGFLSDVGQGFYSGQFESK